MLSNRLIRSIGMPTDNNLANDIKNYRIYKAVLQLNVAIFVRNIYYYSVTAYEAKGYYTYL